MAAFNPSVEDEDVEDDAVGEQGHAAVPPVLGCNVTHNFSNEHTNKLKDTFW